MHNSSALQIEKGTLDDPLVYVVVLNYNGRELSLDCIQSISDQLSPRYRLLFVDNDSSDGSVESVRAEFPEVEVLTNSENLFFAEGNNQGIAYALERGADYIFILNNDTRIEAGCLNSLVRFMDAHPEVGACQPPLVSMYDSQRIASAGCELSLVGKAWDRMCGAQRNVLEREPVPILAATGGALFVRAKAIVEVGGFDSEYVMYFEDVDLGIRLRQKGYTVYFVPGPAVLHKVSTTTKQLGDCFRVALCERNSFRLVLRYYPMPWILVGFLTALCLSFAVALRYGLNGDVQCTKGILIALGKVLISIPAELRRRRSKPRKNGQWESLVHWTQIIPPHCTIS